MRIVPPPSHPPIGRVCQPLAQLPDRVTTTDPPSGPIWQVKKKIPRPFSKMFFFFFSSYLLASLSWFAFTVVFSARIYCCVSHCICLLFFKKKKINRKKYVCVCVCSPKWCRSHLSIDDFLANCG